MKIPPFFRLFVTLLLVPLILSQSGCARLGIWQKAGLIVGTAGAAGTVIMTSNYAGVGASVASGVGAAVVGGGAVMIVDAVEATPAQINAVEAAGKRYLDAMSADQSKKYQEKGKNLIAISIPQHSKSRGQGSVMLFDTKKRKVGSKKIFDVRTMPKVGQSYVFETQQAEYVGYLPMMKNDDPNAVVNIPPANPVASGTKR